LTHQNPKKKFWGEGTAPSPDLSPIGEGDTPSPNPTPLAPSAPQFSRLGHSTTLLTQLKNFPGPCELVRFQWDQTQTQQSTRQISIEMGLKQYGIVQIIHCDIGLKCLFRSPQRLFHITFYC